MRTKSYFVQPVEHPGMKPAGPSVVNGYVQLSIEEPQIEGAAPREFPKEKLKTCVAVILLFVSGLTTTTVISIIHEWVPERNIPPLPDVFFMRITRIDWAFKVSESIGVILLVVLLIVLFLHKHR